MEFTITIARVGPTNLAVVKRRAPRNELSRVVPEACGTVWSALKAAGVQGAGRHVALYLGASGRQIETEIGAEVPAGFQGQGEVIGSATPSGEVATATHYGPYNTLGQTHDAIKNWCSAQNRVLEGRWWEIYGHWLDEWNSNPAKIRTDIFYLLKS